MNKKLLSLILALFLSVSFASISSATLNVSPSADTVKHPVKKEVYVYAAPYSKKYHTTVDCFHIRGHKGLRKITLSEAIAERLTPCKDCNPPTLSSTDDDQEDNDLDLNLLRVKAHRPIGKDTSSTKNTTKVRTILN
jgi:hypothetical protein